MSLALAANTWAAADPGAADPEATAAKPPFRVARGTSHFIQKYSGLNWLTNSVASTAASAILTAKTHGLVKATVKTYNFTDLFDGEFKSVEIRMHGGKLAGVPVGNIHLATASPFKLHYFQHKSHNSGLRTPLLVAIDGDMAARELTNALRSERVSSGLRFLKLDLPGLGEQRLQVLEPKVELVGDKVHINSWLVTAGAPKASGVPLDLLATPTLASERFVVLNDLQVNSPDIIEPAQFSAFAQQLFNPLFDFGRLDRFTHAIRFSKLEVADEHVNFAGRLLLAPKPARAPTFSAPFQAAPKAPGQG